MNAIRSTFFVSMISGLMLVLLAAIGAVQAWLHYDHAAGARQAELVQVADLLRIRTERSLQRRLVVPRALAAFAQASPVLDPREFATFADALVPAVVNGVVLVPGSRVDDLVAGSPAQAAVARTLFRSGEQRPSITQAMVTRQTVLSDPVRIDGRSLVVAYDPIFTRHGGQSRYWGMSATFIDLDRLLAEIGLQPPAPGRRYAIRSLGRDLAEPEMIVGDRDLLAQAQVSRIASFPGGAWEIAVTAPPASDAMRALLVGAGPAGLGSLLVLALIAVHLKAHGTQRAAIANARISADIAAIKLGGAQAQLRNALETMSEGFAYYDRDDRLVIFNERYREMFAASAEIIRPGIRFEDVIRHGVAHGQYPDVGDDPEAFIARRLAIHREAGGRVEMRLSGDRWVMLAEHRTPDGGIVGIRTDITELKRRSLEIEDQQILLRATLESLDDGVAVFDAEGMLVLWNLRFATLADIDPVCLERGIGLPALLAVQGRDGVLGAEDIDFAVGPGHLDDSRLTLGRRTARSGRVVRIELCWTPGSQTVLTLVDETEAEHAAQALATSEQRLRGILEISPVGILVLDRQGLPLFYNDRHREMLGLSHEDMRGYVGGSSFDDPADLRHMILALREHGVLHQHEVRLRRANGAIFWVSLSAQNLLFDGKKATIYHFFDITELKQVEEMLGEINKELEWRVQERVAERDRTLVELRAEMKRSQLLAAVIETSPSSITIADAQVPDLPLIYCNPAFTAMTGYTQDEVVGRNCRFLVGPETAPEARTALREALAAGRRVQTELVNYRKDGTRFLSQLSLFPVRSEAGEILYFVGAQADVTAMRQAEAERIEMQAKMSETSKFEALGTLAGGIAHEINTPSQYIGDNMRFLQGSFGELMGLARACGDAGGVDLDFLGDEVPAALDQCLEGVERISQIVQAIKEFSYPTDKKVAPFDLNRAIQTAVTVTRNQWKYVANLDLALDEDLPLFCGNQGEINQVLLNAIVNAAHAIEERQAPELGRITLSTRLVGDEIELAISDSGVGIPAERREKVFELFFTTKPPGRGTGQGLAITRSIIVQRHGGRIELDSIVGAGTTFRFLLPMHAMMEREVA